LKDETVFARIQFVSQRLIACQIAGSLKAARSRSHSLILLRFRSSSIVFGAIWRGLFWCEAGAVAGVEDGNRWLKRHSAA
jgi:hypothetical protein